MNNTRRVIGRPLGHTTITTTITFTFRTVHDDSMHKEMMKFMLFDNFKNDTLAG